MEYLKWVSVFICKNSVKVDKRVGVRSLQPSVARK